jgi:2-hydroxy-3-oxopropionate reductase
MTVQAIGFVGLGAMGGPIAQRLQAAGHDLVVFDSRPEAADELLPGGGTQRAASSKEVADRAGIVFVSLPVPGIVQEVATGPDGLLGGAAIRTYVDISTTGPAVAESVAGKLQQRGIAVVDAPLSGGPAGARAGKLTAMVAGTSEAINRVRPLLDAFAARIYVVGDAPGQGQAAKVINNLMSATSIAITAEAMVLGVKAGLDPATLLDVIGTSSGANNAAADKFPKQVLTREFNHGFRMELMAKDARLAVDEARRRSVPMPVGTLVSELWSLADPQVLGEDCTAIVRMFEEWGHATIESGTEERAR